MSSGAEKDMVVAALRTGALPPLRLQGSHSVFSMDTPHRSTHCLCLVLGLFLPCSLSFHTGAPSVFHSHRHTQGTPRAPSDTGSLALRWATLFTRGEEEGWGLKLSPSPAQVKLMTQRGRVGLELRLERRQRLMVGPHYQFVFWKLLPLCQRLRLWDPHSQSLCRGNFFLCPNCISEWIDLESSASARHRGPAFCRHTGFQMCREGEMCSLAPGIVV